MGKCMPLHSIKQFMDRVAMSSFDSGDGIPNPMEAVP
jgi:hypothetical protein